MAKFTDRLGRTWTLSLTIGSADQVEQDTGIDLLKWIDSAEGADNRTVFRIVGSLLALDIAGRGLTAQEFASGFDGAALERAGAALVEELLFFSQPQKVAAAALPKMREAMEAMHEKAAAAIAAQDFRSWPGPSPASAGSTPDP